MAEVSFVPPVIADSAASSQASGSGEMEEAPELSLQQLRDIIRDLTKMEEEYINLLRQREELEELRQREDQVLDTKEPEELYTWPPITSDMVIDFINAIYYADQYWDLKQYLQCLPIVYTSGSFFDIYLKKLKESGKTFELDEENLRDGVYYHTMELRGQLHLKRKAERKKVKLIELYGDKKMYTEEEQSRVDHMLPPDFQYEPQTDTFALSNPIWELVLRARKNEHVMDKDPLKELERHKGLISPFYLMQRRDTSEESRREYLENTVVLRRVSGHTYVQDVEKLLSSCGEISYSKLESGKGKIRSVYVTFNDSEGAKRALEKKTLRVRQRVIAIETLQPESNDVGVTSGDKIDAHARALVKYRALIEKFARMSHEVKDDVGVLANFTQLPTDVKDNCAENFKNEGKSK